MLNIKVSNNEIKNTNEYILNNYGEIEDIKNLILPLLLLENIPIDLLANFGVKYIQKTVLFIEI